MVEHKTRGGYTILIDDSDAWLLKHYRVHVFQPLLGHTKYAALRERNYGPYVGLLHCLVIGFKGVDHINGNGLDCQRHNLRHADGSENQRNRRHTRILHKGVYWRDDRNTWTAKITVRGMVFVLGCFDTYEQALSARLFAEKVHFGQFNGIGTQNAAT